MVTVRGRSFVGTSRDVNQDAYCVLVAETSFGDASLVAVCDGVGGLLFGEVASSVAVQEISRWFEESFPVYAASNSRGGSVDLSNLVGAWTTLLEGLNDRILRRAQGANTRMGTTLTVLLTVANRFAAAHIGDCRAYRFRNGSFEQLTRDQTLIQREVDAGRVSAEVALTHPRGSLILQALGAQEDIDPEFYFGDVEEGDSFLVACDGFYRRLDFGGFAHALACVDAANESFLGEVIDDAIDEVVDKGELDNITAVLLHVCELDSATAVLLPGDDVTESLDDLALSEPTVADEDPTRGFIGDE